LDDAALKQKRQDWRARVGAQMPSPNPAYAPAKGQAKKKK
jgi:hypothetical protein